MSDEILNDNDNAESLENLVDQESEELGGVESAESVESKEDQEPSLEDQLASTKDQLLRALAESENLRKRGQREKEEMAQYAVTNFARDLLSVADNLKRAVESVEDAEHEAVKGFLEGVAITEKELLKVFAKYKIQGVEALDKPFDPNFHQAVIEISTEEKEPGIIVQEMQTGYTISGRLLRPAMVGIAKK